VRPGRAPRFSGLRLGAMGSFSADEGGCRMSATTELFLIREAWNRGMDVEDLADGFGAGAGTHGDWSGIRDSSNTAVEKMFERTLNHLFPEGP